MSQVDLFSPGFLGSLELKNRLIVAPMTTYASLPNGDIDPEEIPYLRARAEGGFGAIMTAACYVHPSGHAFRGQWACSDDRFLPSLASVADAIREGGSKSILQIHHGGRQCPVDLVGEPLSASAIPSEREGAPVPREMTEEEILRTIDDFAQAARRAKQAGFDAVEIHGANTYLIQQFVSPHSNRRTDRWNADDLLFPSMLVDAVLAAVGPDFPVGYRFSSEEPETPGIRMDHTFRLVDLLAQKKLAFLHVSLRHFDQSSHHDEDPTPITTRIHERIAGRMPLITVGGVLTGDQAQAALDTGAEFVAIGRGALYDQAWVKKAARGETPLDYLPSQGLKEAAILPQGLADKIMAVQGWLNVRST